MTGWQGCRVSFRASRVRTVAGQYPTDSCQAAKMAAGRSMRGAYVGDTRQFRHIDKSPTRRLALVEALRTRAGAMHMENRSNWWSGFARATHQTDHDLAGLFTTGTMKRVVLLPSPAGAGVIIMRVA